MAAKYISQLLLALLTSLFLFSFGGQLEGYFAPVVDNTRLITVEPVGETSSRVTGAASKLRDCEFYSLEWRLGVPGNSALADIHFDEGTKVRQDGDFDFGPWTVQLTPQQLQTRSYAVVLHRCHPFWLTESRFYP